MAVILKNSNFKQIDNGAVPYNWWYVTSGGTSFQVLSDGVIKFIATNGSGYLRSEAIRSPNKYYNYLYYVKMTASITNGPVQIKDIIGVENSVDLFVGYDFGDYESYQLTNGTHNVIICFSMAEIS